MSVTHLAYRQSRWIPRGSLRGSRWGSRWGFWTDQRGQGLVEYALILITVSIAIILAMVFFRDQLGNLFSNIGNNVT
ncbi:MAG TPA: Flp family type IVb pilin [Candidatus Limnocylindria bacterium]